MKPIYSSLFVLMMSITSLSQLPTFRESVRVAPGDLSKIELLKSSRDDVIDVLSGRSLSVGGFAGNQTFYMDDWVISMTYSKGDCSDDWDVPEGTVTEISVDQKNRIRLEDLGFDYSKFRRERSDSERKGIYNLYDKPNGIALSISMGGVGSLTLFPSAKNYSKLCGNPEVREYYASKRWRRNRKPFKGIIDYNRPADVTALQLDRTELAACQPDGNGGGPACRDHNSQVSVTTTSVDPEYDVLTYFYKVSGGKIIGTGAKVVWDLSGVKAGTYTITAAVDDGCGLCGKFGKYKIIVR